MRHVIFIFFAIGTSLLFVSTKISFTNVPFIPNISKYVTSLRQTNRAFEQFCSSKPVNLKLFIKFRGTDTAFI